MDTGHIAVVSLSARVASFTHVTKNSLFYFNGYVLQHKN